MNAENQQPDLLDEIYEEGQVSSEQFHIEKGKEELNRKFETEAYTPRKAIITPIR